jgi:hypothetical protein
MLHTIRPVIELPQGTLTSKYAYVGGRDFQRWFDDAEPGELMVLKLTGTSGLIRYVAVGGSHDAPGPSTIYLPASIMDEFVLAGSNKVRATVVYELERATKIVLKPLDSLFYASGDMREVVENALMDYPLLQAHTQFSIELEQLGGYVVDMWVESCEPAEVVQLGGEVELEFVEGLVERTDDGGITEALEKLAIAESEVDASAASLPAASPPAASPPAASPPATGLPPPPPFANGCSVLSSNVPTPTAPTAAELAAIREARIRSFTKKN